MYRFIMMSVLFSTSCLQSMQNYTYFSDDWSAVMEKIQDDVLVRKLCIAAYNDCPEIIGHENDYDCQVGYDAKIQHVIDIEIIRKEDRDKGICSYQYDVYTTELKKINLKLIRLD